MISVLDALSAKAKTSPGFNGESGLFADAAFALVAGDREETIEG
jgi:hypothetical protein